MSLLMQALKKAEQAKKKQEVESESGPAEEFAPAPEKAAPKAEAASAAAETPSMTSSRPAEMAEMKLVDHDAKPEPRQDTLAAALELEAPPSASHVNSPVPEPGLAQEAKRPPAVALPAAPPPAPPVKPLHAPAYRQPEPQTAEISKAQQKAKTVFASKQKAGGSRKSMFVAAGVLVLLSGTGIGYYVWKNTSYTSSFTVAGPGAAGPVATPNPAPAADASTMADQPPQQGASDQSASASAPQARPAAMASASEPAEPAERTAAASNETSGRNVPAESRSIRIKQDSTINPIHPALVEGYQAFIGGDLAAAHQQYRKVLQQDANNRDALLGMAAIALRRNQPAQAGSFFTRLLELNPADNDAVAGLASLHEGDPSQTESRLKKSLTQDPQSAPVLFELGNLSAQQSRWSDAQQYYFRAFGSAPGNADYAFNLAVSLDRLNQEKLALEYYQKALTLSQAGSAAFSKTAAQTRSKELQAALNND